MTYKSYFIFIIVKLKLKLKLKLNLNLNLNLNINININMKLKLKLKLRLKLKLKLKLKSNSKSTRQITHWMLEEGVTDKEFSFFQDETDFMDRAASTLRSNCVLDTTKSEQAGVGMRPVEEAVRDSLRKMKQGCLV